MVHAHQYIADNCFSCKESYLSKYFFTNLFRQKVVKLMK